MYQQPYDMLELRFKSQIARLKKEHGISKIETVFECQWNARKLDKQDPVNVFLKEKLYPKKSPSRIPLRRLLTGGKVETYRLLFKAHQHPNFKGYFVDVNALYAEVSRRFMRFPTGKCITLSNVSS